LFYYIAAQPEKVAHRALSPAHAAAVVVTDVEQLSLKEWRRSAAEVVGAGGIARRVSRYVTQVTRNARG